MATIDNKEIIDKLIANDGYHIEPNLEPGESQDPRVFQIVEYTNYEGRTTWGVTWINEAPSARVRYMLESPYVCNPRVIWRAKSQ